MTDSVAFTGIPLEPEVLDSLISVTNEQGAAVTTYNAGDLGYFSTKMTTKSTSQILVTVSVLDAQQNTLGVGFFKTVLPKGDAEIVLGFEIPEGTISGDAQVFTNFFTDWPDQGGISIGEEVSSKVNIIGVEPVEEVVEVLEEPVANASHSAKRTWIIILQAVKKLTLASFHLLQKLILMEQLHGKILRQLLLIQ